MISVVLGPGECNGGVAVVLRGEFGVAGAARVPAGGACSHEVIAGLAGLEFIGCCGVRVPQRVRMLPPGGRAGGAGCRRSVPDVWAGLVAGRD
jgi:hypothetical protein